MLIGRTMLRPSLFSFSARKASQAFYDPLSCLYLLPKSVSEEPGLSLLTNGKTFSLGQGGAIGALYLVFEG